MTPDACPNCSGYIPDPGHWVIGRPKLIISRRTKRITIIGCCDFSGQSRHSFETEEEACRIWSAYRAAKSARDPRLKNMMAQLDELELRRKPSDTQSAA